MDECSVRVPLMTWGNGGRMARVGEAWKARRAMGVRWASSWRDSRAGRNEVAIVCVCEVNGILLLLRVSSSCMAWKRESGVTLESDVIGSEALRARLPRQCGRKWNECRETASLSRAEICASRGQMRSQLY